MDSEALDQLIGILKEEIVAKRIRLNSHQTMEDLAKVRYGPNGVVDPLSVSSSVRALALAVAGARAQREMRKTSLLEVQTRYYEMLTPIFAKPFEEMKKHGLDPQVIAADMASQRRIVDAFREDLDAFAEGIQEFWDFHGPIVEMHLQELNCLKAVFGGDIFPSYTANIACSVGLYTDTIVLPDPLHRLITFKGVMKEQELFRLTVKHALNALNYKELALAGLDFPIVAITPDYLADESYRDSLSFASEGDSLEHFSRIFGREFKTPHDVNEFLRKLKTPKEFVAALVDRSRFLFDSEWNEPLENQFEKYATETEGQFNLGLSELPPLAARMILGRMMQSNDAVFRGMRFGGTPLIDAETSWRYLLWKYEYNGNQRKRFEVDRTELVVNKAISLEGREFGMLSGIPIETLIELRRRGALSELRDTIRKGMSEIDSARETAVEEAGRKVIENIDNAFEEHSRMLSELSASKMKFYGFDVSRWLVTGGLSVAASVVQSIPLALLAAMLGMTGPPSPTELRKKFKELSAQSETLRRSPTGLMFRHLKGNFGFNWN